jgi:hypothetical protein
MPRKPARRVPAKPATKIYTFVLPVPLIEAVDELAHVERRTRTQQVALLLDHALQNYQRSTVRGAPA